MKCSRAITVVGRFLVARKPALSAAMKPSDMEVMKVMKLIKLIIFLHCNQPIDGTIAQKLPCLKSRMTF